MVCCVSGPVEGVCAFAQEAPEQGALIAGERLQLVTLVAPQEITEALPDLTRVGVALMCSVGLFTLTSTVVEQPPPH